MAKITGDVDIRAGAAEFEIKSASAEAFIEKRARPGADAPDILYHYTSAQGLIDILKSWEIWATSIGHLNDASEYVHTLRLADQLPTNALVNDHWKLDRYLIDSVKSSGGPPVYVASFSGDGNLLSQWRAYCPPGNGYSIGFSRERLQRCAHDTTKGVLGFPGYDHYDRWQLVKCEYDAEEQSNVLRQLLGDAHKAVESLEVSERAVLETFVDTHGSAYPIEPQSVATIRQAYTVAVERVAPAFKDHAFKEEGEWRIVSPRWPDRRPEFRGGRFSVIPFVRFKLPLIAGLMHVERIVIGPTENPGLAYNTLMLLCETLGITLSSVEQSGVPLRHWDSKQS